jgi:glycosyltransferase involved in cell wall biosynthesis
MRIAIDSFHPGLATGTGIATYTRELSRLLAAAGHEVMPIFGLNGVDARADIAWSEFIQALMTQGEASRYDFRAWAPRCLLGMPGFLAHQPFAAQEIRVRDAVDISPIRERLPAFGRLFNLPSLYRSAQARAWLFRSPTYIELPDDATPDIFHLTLPLPISMQGVKKVVTVHDVIPLALPHTTEINLRHYEQMFQTALRDADLVCTVSEHSKRDLMRFMRVPEEKIHVTWQAVNLPEHYRNLPDAEVASYVEGNFALQHKKYFLFYGTIEPRKNVMRMLEAFGLADTPYPVVVVGRYGWLCKDVQGFFQQNPWPEKFRRMDYVSFRNLMYLLKGARALVFPSLYEGFGLPVLEAMQMGCPVITSNNSSLPEVGGDAALYVDPLDVRSLADAIESLANDHERVTAMVEKGYIQAEKFSVAQHQTRLLAAYARL